jgi:hypothetical protein
MLLFAFLLSFFAPMVPLVCLVPKLLRNELLRQESGGNSLNREQCYVKEYMGVLKDGKRDNYPMTDCWAAEF